MDSSNSQNHQIQEMDSQTLESMLICTMPQQEKKPKPSEQALPCPRCESINTKFCYYNNYSLSQPRYFCKSCRRYWTKGGTLRNVPVGGGCRKTKRSSSKRFQDQPVTTNPSPIMSPCLTPPLISYDSNDRTLAFAMLQKETHGQMGLYDFSNFGNPNMPHHGNSSLNGMFFDETQSGLNNVYYGNGNSQEFGFEHSRVATSVKQEMRVNEREGEHKVLWGYPWSGDSNSMGEVDFGRSMNWNGIGISNWHGLLNNPLM